MSLRVAILIGALLGASGVGLGAYHAHGLEAKLAKQGLAAEEVEQRVAQGDVGVRYQMVHALVLLFLGLLAERQASICLKTSAWCFTLGVLLFSGGLYMLSLGGPAVFRHWAIVPIGGLTLIVGWTALIGHAVRMRA